MTVERAQAALAKDPTNGSAVAVGAGAFAVLGEADRAREWIQRALLLDPDNISMCYNLACALAVELGEPEAALDVLESFFKHVMSPIHLTKHLEGDPDMDSLRDHPRFKKMLAAAKKRLGIPG